MMPNGLRVSVRVQPGARRTAIDGLRVLNDGRAVLALRVGAAPEGGKANAAVIDLLAKTWQLPKSTLHIDAGHGQRRKSVFVAGDTAALKSRLEAWIAALPQAQDHVAEH